RAVEFLIVDEQARLEIAFVRQPNLDSGAPGGPPGVVHFANLPVDAILGEVAAPDEPADAVRRRKLELGTDILELDRGVAIDRPTLGRRDDGVSIRVEEAALDDRSRFVPSVAREIV